MLLAKALAVWLALLALAILNGALRERFLTPVLGEAAALPASGALLSLAILAVTWAALPWFGALTSRQHLAIGALWLLSTVAFELAFGRWVLGRTWDELRAAYRFEGGNLWPLVSLCTLLAPWLGARLRAATRGR